MREEKSKSGKVKMRNKALFIGIVAIALAVAAIGATANNNTLSLMFVTTPQPYIAPEAFFTYEPENPVAYQVITFDGSSSTADPDLFIEDYEWNFGDDTFGSGEYSEKHYPSAGTYVVTLTVRDNIGGLSPTSKTVIVGEAWYPWSMFHHDAQRTGAGRGGIETIADNLRWTYTLQSPAPSNVPSSPVVGKDGTVYAGSMGAPGFLYAIVASTGALRWVAPTTAFGSISTAPAISPDGTRVYACTLESASTQPNVIAYDAATGAKLWTAMAGNGLTLPSNDYVSSSNPIAVDIGGTTVIFVCGTVEYGTPGKYRLYRIEDQGNMATWTYYDVGPLPVVAGNKVSPSPAVADDWTVYVTTSYDSSVPMNGALYAIDGASPTMTLKWRLPLATTPVESPGLPSIREDGGLEIIYCGVTDWRMCKVKEDLSQTSASVIWVYTTASNTWPITCPAIADLDANPNGYMEVVFTALSLTTTYVYALHDEGTSYSLYWSTTLDRVIPGSPALGALPVAPPYQYHVFLGGGYMVPAKIYTLNGWDGAWDSTTFETGGTMSSSPAVAQPIPAGGGVPGWVFVTSNDFGGDGKLYAFGPDSTSPSAVTDLATSDPTTNSITLTWSAPGDDDNTGTASEYDIRYSTLPITEANWDAATQCIGEPAPQPAGNSEIFTVTRLSRGTTYYFALKTGDEVPNWSPLSNIASGTTLLFVTPRPSPIF